LISIFNLQVNYKYQDAQFLIPFCQLFQMRGAFLWLTSKTYLYKMKTLVIDWGNTRIKAAIFVEQKLEEKFLFNEPSELYAFLSEHHFAHTLISSVNKPAQEVLKKINATGKKLSLSIDLPLPIKIEYATPHTLGVDRIAAACGAIELFPLHNTLVIDAGTCVNYEFVDSNSRYWGGAISPGIEMRFKAMNTFTARLPLVSLNKEVDLIGNSTESCMQSGVMNGIVGEVEGMIDRYKEKYPELKVVLCGGDAPLFENRLKPTIFAAPDLVLMGLNRILRYNAS
jgi:type III pantothenate kinase